MAGHNYRLGVALVGLLLLEGAARPAARDVRTDGLLALHKAGDVSAPTYVNGILSGFDHANARLIAEGQRPLYCRRPDDALSANDVLEATAKATGQLPQKGKLSATLVILHVLIEAFPCPPTSTTGIGDVAPEVTLHGPGSADAPALPQGERRQGEESLPDPAEAPAPE